MTVRFKGKIFLFLFFVLFFLSFSMGNISEVKAEDIVIARIFFLTSVTALFLSLVNFHLERGKIVYYNIELEMMLRKIGFWGMILGFFMSIASKLRDGGSLLSGIGGIWEGFLTLLVISLLYLVVYGISLFIKKEFQKQTPRHVL